MASGVSEIQNFYNGQNVFITGGTGFIGKVLMEKLLRSTQVSTIYVLIRNKKGKDLHTRFDEIFEDVLFDRLKAECPKFKHRVVGISGDCSLSGLNLTITDRHTLIANVNIVFHAAATVRFDENIKLAYAINVNGTRDVVDLCRQMKGLKSIVHISTAYSNCHLHEIDEQIYEYPVNYEDVGTVLEKVSSEEANKLTTRIIGKWPNTYTFTKALAESLIKNRAADLPICIFRPSIIISTYKEPIEGWIDNFYGATGVCAAASTGLLKIFPCDSDVVANLVPVDTCVAGVIAAAWDVSVKTNNSNTIAPNDDVKIYNYVSSVENPITWGEFQFLNVTKIDKFPVSKSIGPVLFNMTKNYQLYLFLRFFLHIVPALFMDLGSLAMAQKPCMLSMYKKIHKLSNVLRFFCTNEWKYKSDNTVKLWHKMNNHDRELFPLSIRTVSWFGYFEPYLVGMRTYLMQDPLSTLEYAKRRQRRFNVIHKILMFLFNFILMVSIWTILTRLYSSLSSETISYPNNSLINNSTLISS